MELGICLCSDYGGGLKKLEKSKLTRNGRGNRNGKDKSPIPAPPSSLKNSLTKLNQSLTRSLFWLIILMIRRKGSNK